mgnify:CR=1 FL=1
MQLKKGLYDLDSPPCYVITACHACNNLIYNLHESLNACFLILFPENAKLRLFNKTVLGIIFISGLTFNDMVYNITLGSTVQCSFTIEKQILKGTIVNLSMRIL